MVLAPSSMTDVMGDLADAWEAQGHPRPVLSLAGTPSLARQIEAGAPADVVITADEEWMGWLTQTALVDPSSRLAVAGNALVFVERIDGVLPSSGGKIAMGDPESVPAGRYAKAAMEAAGVWEEVSAHVVPAENVRAALLLVERGEADAGIVYVSDAAASGRVRAVPFPHPLPDGMAIIYPAALVAGARHPDAQAFLAFLASDEGAAIICARGFTMPEGRDPC